uniref:Uncharacterized protein LOC114343635 n=1 Tax=Diabrotica virgifera virgifera TaxID=50390 RepID=A0A6P7GXX3_DIAVI
MNSGPLPPVPGLIPISALRKRPPSNNNIDGNSDGGLPECAPCASNREVMGEQRPRRRSGNQPAVELIDNAGSRGSSAAPQALLSRKVRPERHRKSDRRRERRKLTRTRSCSKHSKSREINSEPPPVPINPRVNPIFVWVRQEDTRIVDVKCEDYDKRNRIVLTKTAQGWRAIPRTETLVPTLKEAVKDHHHHHKNKRSRKNKVRRRSTGVQVCSDIEQDYEEPEQLEPECDKKFDDKQIVSSPPWMSSDNVNIESLLPSHTIKVKRSTSPNHSPKQDSNVNSDVTDCTQTPTIKCSADKICDVSPLDNLLAVAELEFKQQIESEEWNKTTQDEPTEDTIVTFNNFAQSDEDKEFMKNLETLNSLIDSEKSKLDLTQNVDDSIEPKSEECDYNDDDDNNLAMDDILSRLEQSLRSPENTEANTCDTNTKTKPREDKKEHTDSDNETDLKSVPDYEHYFEETDPKIEEQKVDTEEENIKQEPEPIEIIDLVESSTNDDEEDETPTDLSIKVSEQCTNIQDDVSNAEEPTDLSVPKACLSPRPPSQNSETIQSPQPSGIPAVPQSPDIVSTTVNVSNKTKSIFLESLLTNSTKKLALNSEVTITAQMEPLDLGKCRKSASPTITCSEEINSSLSQLEPPSRTRKMVQYEEPEQLEPECDKKFDDKQIVSSPPWMSSDNVNIESLLPSHTIKVKRSTSPNHSPKQDSNVNSDVTDCTQTPTIKCSADKICDVSPLDNLLAVAELEFKQQIESEEWNKTTQDEPTEDTIVTFNNFAQSDEDKEFMKNLETLNSLIDSEKSKLDLTQNVDDSIEPKSEECDYNDDDDNNLAMDDILSRLEQSLRSPENTEANTCDTNTKTKPREDKKEHTDSDNETDLKSVPDYEHYFEETDPKIEEQKVDTEEENIKQEPEPIEIIDLVESSTNDDEEDETPTDLSIKVSEQCTNIQDDVSNAEEPTDLSVPKACLSPRPPSQNSETIQSPQPSGIPAVPQSPDIVSTTVNVSNKTKSIFLESLLTNSTKKLALNSEVTITAQMEPLDLGKCRKSASPTITCSEEINSSLSQLEPPAKKIKSVDITLKNLLDAECQNTNTEKKNAEKHMSTETPKLLELLQTESEVEPLIQLKQLLSDPTIDVPDPILVPKERFSQILLHPGTEIPKLLKERPELRLPQALAYPHIMQDPNMLVINIHHLESILCNKNSLQKGNKPSSEVKAQDKHEKQSDKASTDTSQAASAATKKKPNESTSKLSAEAQTKIFNELANDINAATQAAFNQMSWFPYMNQFEAMTLPNNPEFMKMLNSLHLPFYLNQMNQMPEMFANVRPPASMGFPMPPPPMNYANPMEINMWQEAMLRAQLLKNRPVDNANNEQNMFANYFEKMNATNTQSSRASSSNNCMNPRAQNFNKPQSYSNQYYKNDQSSFHSPYSNHNYQAKSSHQLHQKHATNQKLQSSMPTKSSTNFSHQMNHQNFANLYSQMTDMEKHQYMQNLNNVTAQQDQFHQNFQNFMRKDHVSQKQKMPSKSLSNSHQKSLAHQEAPHHREKSHPVVNDGTKPHTNQPIDLSGSMAGAKLKVKQHLIDPTNTPKLLKQHDDVPEVGSTTASIEEMQDAHKHLWHPLFG